MTAARGPEPDTGNAMSCIAVTDRKSRLLAALTGGPRPADQLDRREVDVFRR
jgi:hypothetical protein